MSRWSRVISYSATCLAQVHEDYMRERSGPEHLVHLRLHTRTLLYSLVQTCNTILWSTERGFTVRCHFIAQPSEEVQHNQFYTSPVSTHHRPFIPHLCFILFSSYILLLWLDTRGNADTFIKSVTRLVTYPNRWRTWISIIVTMELYSAVGFWATISS